VEKHVKSQKIIKFAAVAVLGFAANAALADCAFPKPPQEIPDGKSASEDQMKSAMNAFKAYKTELEAFGACLDTEAKESASMAAKAMQSKKIAAANEEFENKAKAFNEQVRIFKSKAG
jgi:hypothetical protein